MVFADFSTVGDHGIGRFAKEVLDRCNLQPLEVGKSPSSPIYALHVAHAIRRIGKDDLFFSPSYIPPLWSRSRFVFTIHDLNHIDRPENSSFIKRQFYERFLKPSCWRAAKVLTVSEFSRRRILDWAGLPPSRVTNVGNGVDGMYQPAGPAFAPGYPYYLCVSNRRGHKNELRLLHAFAAAKLSPETRLVLTGGSSTELLTLARELGVSARVVYAGKVAEADLPALYRGATALTFPSLYEGFGLPVVEAMACGTPVITSNVTSLPEIAGTAALLVDPLSVSAITSAIEALESDDVLRQRLIHDGQLRSKLYSWEHVAARVGRVFEEVCAN